MKLRVFLLLSLIFLPYRLYHVTYPILDTHHFRQTQTATFARNIFRHGLQRMQTEIDIYGIGKERFLTLEFPLYEMVLALLYKLFFYSDIWGRIISIVSGYLGAWYLSKIHASISKEKSSPLYSTFFFLIAPLNMFFHRTVMIEPFLIALLLSGMYYFFRWIDTKQYQYGLVSLFLFTLGCLQKGFYGFFWTMPMLSYIVYQQRSITSLLSKGIISYFLFLGVCVGIWQIHVDTVNTISGHAYFTSTDQGQWAWNVGTWQDRLDMQMWLYRWNSVFGGVFLKPGLFFFICGLFAMTRKRGGNIFLVWLIAELSYFCIFFRIQSHNYYQMIMIPSIAIIVGEGCAIIARSIRWMVGIREVYWIPIIFAYMISKYWIASSTSFSLDMTWYHDLSGLHNILPKKPGILVLPSYDWNSAYTYYPDRTFLLVSSSSVHDGDLSKWQAEGYAFLLMYPYRDTISSTSASLYTPYTDFPGKKYREFEILRFK